MSIALFHDTVTLYLSCEDGTYERRVIDRVKTVLEQADRSGQTEATVYIPLWGKRSLRYCPDGWDGRADRFTVRPGDRLVCRRETSEAPPSDALPIRTVTDRQSGSRRLWHLEIHAESDQFFDFEEVFPDEGTAT